SWASNLPLFSRVVGGLEVEGFELRSKSDTVQAVVNTVDLNYFETMNIPVTRGRDFTLMDREGSSGVVIVNEKLARDYWPNAEVLGKHVRLPGEKQRRQIVGVVKTTIYSRLAEPPQACVYVPLQQTYSDAMNLYVRSRGDPEALMRAVQREIRE